MLLCATSRNFVDTSLVCDSGDIILLLFLKCDLFIIASKFFCLIV